MTTQARVKYLFDRFCSIYNLRNDGEVLPEEVKGIVYKEPFLKLDQFGGYRLMIIRQDTSETYFDGAGRKTASEMINYLNGLIDAKTNEKFPLITK